MIKSFNDIEVRESGIIYNSTFDQIKMMYAQDPVKAGELAISAIELILTGQVSSDDCMINIALQPLKVIRNRNANDYDAKKEAIRNKKIETNQLNEIAKMRLEGATQAQIGAKLGISQQIVSNRLKLIMKEFPELLQEDTNTYKDTSCTNFVKSCKNCTDVSNDKIEKKEGVPTQFIF